MKKHALLGLFLILLGIFIFLFLFPFKIEAKELTQEEIEKHIKLAPADEKDILDSLPQVMTEEWIDSVVSVVSAEEEAITLIIRQAVRGKMMDYFLKEGPKEVGKELLKMGFKIGRLVMASDISVLLEEFEKMTVKESLKYLGQWLKENQTKIAVGNLDFSYDTLAGKKQKHSFQYIIIYSPETGEAAIKIYSANPMAPPASRGSLVGAWGTGWNYSQEQVEGKQIPSFILFIEGEMKRKQCGYWGSRISHSYSWEHQPEITIEFPDYVPSFDFRKKGFFEKIGDKIKSFFDKIGDGFSGLFGASLIEPSFDGSHPSNVGSDPVRMTKDSALGEWVEKLLEYMRTFRQFLSQSEYQEIEKEVQDITTGEDLLRAIERLEELQQQMAQMGQTINRLEIEIENGQLSGQEESVQEDEGKKEEKDKDDDEEEKLPESAEVGPPLVLINEVCVGWDSAKNEFVELYNPNDFPVSLNNENFHLKLVSSSNQLTKKKITWNNNSIPSHGYFLLIGGELLIDGKELKADAVFSSQLTNVSGVVVADNDGNVLDKVGWGKAEKPAPASAVEKQGKILDSGLKTGQSLERQSHLDTNNNSSDFSLNQSPSPTNSKGEKGVLSQEQTGSFSGTGAIGGTGAGSGDGDESSDSTGETPDPPPKIVISEVQIEGETKSQDFIELYNPSNDSVDVSGWRLRKRSQNGTESSIRIFPAGSVIPGKGYFLWASSKDEDYPSSVEADAFSTSYLTQDGSAALFDQHQNIIDAVAWGTGHNSPFIEGQAFGVNPKTRDIVGEWLDGLGFTGTRTPSPYSIFYQSLGRKASESGDYQDTDNNVEDFEIQEPTPKSKNKSFIEPVLEDVLKEIDSTSPETEITSHPPLLTNQTQAIFIFQANEENCSFECKLDSQDWESCESPKAYPDLSDGQHKFSVKATDLFLKADPTPAQYTWTIDTAIESPSIFLFDPDTGSEFYTNQKTVGVTVLAASPEEGLGWLLSEDPEKPSADDPDWQNEKPETFILSEPEGSKTVYVWSKDGVGNISPLGNSSSIILDTLAPLSQVLELDASQPSANFSVTWSGSDESGIAYYDIQFRDSLTNPWQDWQAAVQETSADFSGTDSHTYYFRSRATDLAGNIEVWPEAEEGDTFSYVNLSGPPLPEITSPNDGDSFSSGDDVNSETEGVQIIIEGTARAGDTIIWDSQETLVDENNEWQITVTLELGQNTINIRAQETDGDQSGLVMLTLTLTESLEENVFAQDLIISEVRAAGTEEFIELYNPLDQGISLAGFYLSYFSAGRDWNNPHLNKPFPTSTIPSQEYYLISFGDYPGEPDPDWDPYISHLSDDNGSIGIFSCNPKNAATTQQAEDCKIDALGWGETLVKEGTSATSSESKSLARKLAPDEQGYLQYVDKDHNNNDFEEQDSTPGAQNSHSYSDLDNDGIIDSYDPITTITVDITLSAGEYSFKDLVIEEGVTVTINSDPNLEGFKGVKVLAENMAVAENALVSADENGYGSDEGPGKGNSGEGASYGGMGGRNYDKALVYGNLVQPTDLGSGAQGNPAHDLCSYRSAGAGGGALILEVENTLLLDGTVSVNGEDGLPVASYGCGATGAGSGGSVYIITNTLEGLGKITAKGGSAYSSAGAGGGGRIALYYNSNNFTGTFEAYGGTKTYNADYAGGSGTIYLKQESQTLGDLTIDNNGLSGATALVENILTFRNVDISGSAHFYLPASLNCSSMSVEDTSALEASSTSTISVSGSFSLSQSTISAPALAILSVEAGNLSLAASEILANLFLQANNLTADNNSSILPTGLGYSNQEGPGAGINKSGAGYGGRGGKNTDASIYGSEEVPIDFGSGGANASYYGTIMEGGKGGGKIKIDIVENLSIDGEIFANGKDGRQGVAYGPPSTGAGSGGSVYIITNTLEGSGKIAAKGGSAYSSAGAGGGGRIAIYYNTNNFTGQVEANGGQNINNADYNGQEGTIYLSP